jgi:hypothetical protein
MRWAIFLSVLIFAGCDKADSPAPVAPSPRPASQVSNHLPTIVVDANHWIRNETAPSKPYFVPAGAGINLQSSSFAFHDPRNLGRVPNAVQVLYEKSVYTCAWGDQAKQTIVLDGSTLKSLQGGTFANFAMGKQAFIAIGFESSNSKSSDIDFTPFWIASVIFH